MNSYRIYGIACVVACPIVVSGVLVFRHLHTASTDTSSLPEASQEQTPEQKAGEIEKSYTLAADEHRLIVAGERNSYYCKIRHGYEGPDSCGIFLENGGVYTYTGFTATDPDSTLLVSPDKKHILVIPAMDTAVLITVLDGSSRAIYTAPKDTYLGVLTGNADFKGRARWSDNSHIELKVYSVEDAGTDERNEVIGKGKEESKPVQTEMVSI
ncbi:MAG: hypothetical protein V4480_02365 [Patescibacteria group bacterium]